MLSLMTPLFNAGSYVNPVFGSSQPLIINCISLCHTQPLISLLITFYHSLALDRVTTRASALQKTKQGKTRGTYKLRCRIKTIWANKSLCVTGTSHTPPRRRGSFSMHHLVMLPPVFLHLHSCVCRFLHAHRSPLFFLVEKRTCLRWGCRARFNSPASSARTRRLRRTHLDTSFPQAYPPVSSTTNPPAHHHPSGSRRAAVTVLHSLRPTAWPR